MLITQVPLLQVRKNGKLLPNDTFPKEMEKVLKPHNKELGTERETYVFSVDDKRRIAFRK